MGKMNEIALKKLIKGGETNTVELKVAAPRATEMPERLCILANIQSGVVIVGVKNSTDIGITNIAKKNGLCHYKITDEFH